MRKILILYIEIFPVLLSGHPHSMIIDDEIFVEKWFCNTWGGIGVVNDSAVYKNQVHVIYYQRENREDHVPVTNVDAAFVPTELVSCTVRL